MTDREILAYCVDAGLDIAEVAWRDELLLLRPTNFDTLPTAEALGALGDELKRQTGARWIALDVDALVEAP